MTEEDVALEEGGSRRWSTAGMGANKTFAPATIVKTLTQTSLHSDDEHGARSRQASRVRVRESLAHDRAVAKSAIPDLVAEMNSNIKTGLSSEDAATRLNEYGKNELDQDPPRSFLCLLLDQFKDILVILLIIACGVSFALGQYAAAVTIVVIVGANACLGVIMESKAGAAISALEALSSPIVKVIRDSRIIEVDNTSLVPGDIVVLSTGDKIACDMRLVDSKDIASNEAALTGESRPCKKDASWEPDEAKEGAQAEVAVRVDDSSDTENTTTDTKTVEEEAEVETLTPANMVYMGCTITEGTGLGLVMCTGMKTKMGEVALLIKNAEQDESPLQVKLGKLGVILGIAAIVVSLIVFIIGVATGRGVDKTNPQPAVLQMLLVAVSLVVAAVPEGLPACVTITLAVGMQHMSSKKAQIRNLHSVETLGSASVVCTDKTGTLTAGVMTAVRLWTMGAQGMVKISGGGYSPEGHFCGSDADIGTAKSAEAAAIEPKGTTRIALFNALLACDEQTRLQYNEEDKMWECLGNNSEKALVVAAAKADLKRDEMHGAFELVHTNPFTSARKMMSTHMRIKDGNQEFPVDGNSHLVLVKGAPNVVLAQCTHIVDQDGIREITEGDRALVMEQVDQLSDLAFRVLATAFKSSAEAPAQIKAGTSEKDLVFTSLFASIDPERDGVKDSILRAANAGVRTIMITGDYVKTAKAIAENIGLLTRGKTDGKFIDCGTIRNLGEEEQRLKAEEPDNKEALETTRAQIDDITAVVDVFARAKPIDKITIVRSLIRQGHVASMTGDGVNDAPALRKANIGVAMGKTGTDVARGASDMVLTDDNFCSIIDAIEEGRTIYANIGKFCYFLLSTNVAEVFVVLIAVILGYPSPLVPTQILWLNLATDGCPAIALAVEKTEPGVMDEGPRPKHENLIEKVMITGIVIQTIILTTLVLVVYTTGLYWNCNNRWLVEDPQDGSLSPGQFKLAYKKASTMTILVITFAELMRAYTARSLRRSLLSIGVFTNKWMQYSVFSALAGTIAVTCIPGLNDVFGCTWLTGEEYGFVLGLSFIPSILDEVTKLVYRMTGFGERSKVLQKLAHKQVGKGSPSLVTRSTYNVLDEDD